MRVVIFHPGRQHSHQLAIALSERNMLARYVTGVPTQGSLPWLRWSRLQKRTEAYAIPLDPALVKHVYLAAALRRGSRGLGARWAHSIGHFADALFDRYVAPLLKRLRPDVVVAYENSAMCTFRLAKQIGVKTVLDAGSIHHRWQSRLLPRGAPGIYDRVIRRRKDEEIELADEILTVSDLARESYIDAGVPPARVHSVPMGVDTNRFRLNGQTSGCRDQADREFRFVYIGNNSPLKGLDILRAAADLLRSSGVRFLITLIGVAHSSPTQENETGIVRVGWMSHARLAEELPRHDVLVLPSFFDSFGMVVAEGMASGLPAIVTETVGARQMVEPGRNGLIVPPGDPAGLADAMRWFIDRKDELSSMARSSRQSAENYDWSRYRERIGRLFSSFASAS